MAPQPGRWRPRGCEEPSHPARLFAVMLLFFRERGRFPRGAGEIDAEMVTDLARRLDLPKPDLDALFPFGAAERTLERQRAEIRALFAFREATIADAEALGIWLRDYAVAETRDIGRLAAALEERCRAIAIEPPTADRIERIVRAAIHAHEERFAATIHARLSLEARERLDALLHPARTAEDGRDVVEPVGGARAVLNFVRGEPGRASVNSVKRELERLAVIRGLALPGGLFDDALPHDRRHGPAEEGLAFGRGGAAIRLGQKPLPPACVSDTP